MLQPTVFSFSVLLPCSSSLSSSLDLDLDLNLGLLDLVSSFQLPRSHALPVVLFLDAVRKTVRPSVLSVIVCQLSELDTVIPDHQEIAATKKIKAKHPCPPSDINFIIAVSTRGNSLPLGELSRQLFGSVPQLALIHTSPSFFTSLSAWFTNTACHLFSQTIYFLTFCLPFFFSFT